MRHAREDYNRIQDPEGKIPDDEPVVLFRAQDKYAVVAVRAYAKAISADPKAPDGSLTISVMLSEWADVMEEYASLNVSKYPDP